MKIYNMKYYGKRVYEGIAIGKIVRFLNNFKTIKEKKSIYEIEFKRFVEAKEKAIKQYQELHEKALQSLDEEHASIMSIYISLLEDLDFNETISLKSTFSQPAIWFLRRPTVSGAISM